MARAASARPAAEPADVPQDAAPSRKTAGKKAAAAPAAPAAKEAKSGNSAKDSRSTKSANAAKPAATQPEAQAAPAKAARKTADKPASEPAARQAPRSRKPAPPVDATSEPQPADARVGTTAATNAGTGSDGAAPSASTREQRVREAAYRRYLARGQAHGHHEHDWLEAEREVDAQPEGRRKAD